MAKSSHGGAVRRQLREELLARAWAMHSLNPGPADNGAQRQTVARVEASGACWWAQLCDPNPTARRHAASLLERILWPTFRPVEEWWTTPLGEALLACRPAFAPTADAATATACTSLATRVSGSMQTAQPDQDVLLPSAAATA
jgi:hypothetical protein